MGDKIEITIKSNVTLKSRTLIPPIDNMPDNYFDVRLGSALTESQKKGKEKMMYWAKVVLDENNDMSSDNCYKGCENCGEINNNCKRNQNKSLKNG